MTIQGEPTPVDLEVPAPLDGQRVDRVLSMLTGMARSRAAELVTQGAVEVDGRTVVNRSTPLRAGQRLKALVPDAPKVLPVADSNVLFDVVYDDDDLIIVDKPAGLVVHHGAGHHGGTLVDGLLARYPELTMLARQGVGDPTRPGIVHRLDKGTSGLMVVARSEAAFETLSLQMRAHSAERRYLALVAGAVADDNGMVDAPIGRSQRRPDRMAVAAGGRPARTRYVVRTRYDSPLPVTLLEASLETGRTHQVRVHMAAIGHPVIGDRRYDTAHARPKALMGQLASDRLFLHAWRLQVDHPDGRRMSWNSELPSDLLTVTGLLS